MKSKAQMVMPSHTRTKRERGSMVELEIVLILARLMVTSLRKTSMSPTMLSPVCDLNDSRLFTVF